VLDKFHLDLTTPLGRGLIALPSAMAEEERHRIVNRADDGRAAAKRINARGEALKRLDVGESCRSIAKSMAVHHSTISSLAAEPMSRARTNWFKNVECHAADCHRTDASQW